MKHESNLTINVTDLNTLEYYPLVKIDSFYIEKFVEIDDDLLFVLINLGVQKNLDDFGGAYYDDRTIVHVLQEDSTLVVDIYDSLYDSYGIIVKVEEFFN